ncbi:hypothetical protein ACJX0J_017784 [Zea mays]
MELEKESMGTATQFEQATMETTGDHGTEGQVDANFATSTSNAAVLCMHVMYQIKNQKPKLDIKLCLLFDTSLFTFPLFQMAFLLILLMQGSRRRSIHFQCGGWGYKSVMRDMHFGTGIVNFRIASLTQHSTADIL